MNKQFLKDAFLWGFILWLIGFALGMVFFAIVPAGQIGWFVTPIGFALALWVAFKKVKGESFKYYFFVALVWTLIAVVFDYLFLVKSFKPADGYYKLDVYIYYVLTFLIPLLAGWRKKSVSLPPQNL